VLRVDVQDVEAVARDRCRVIWEIFDPEEDYEGLADEVVLVVILRVGPKTDSRGRTIYEAGRPGQDDVQVRSAFQYPELATPVRALFPAVGLHGVATG
jgi:hypothetical protein